MKKNHTMRAASLLLVLTLITSCFVGGTFAKYTTQMVGSDTARVAKFGVVLTATGDMFAPEYAGNDAVSVKSDDNGDGTFDDVIAPGTSGNAVIFTIAGAPEVDVKVTAKLDHTIATLPAGTYTDYTKVVEKTGTNTSYEFDTFTLTADYTPVLWTLTKNDGSTTTTVVDAKTLDEVEAYITGLNGEYDVEADTFDAINGTYTLSWEWPFEGVNDAADTYMGQIAAGVETAPTGYEANESFDFEMVVEQLD